VTPKAFAQQMAYLVSGGYTTVTLDDVIQAVLTGKALPQRPVVLTFDDGYEDFYTAAFPVLEQDGLKATSFIITGRVGMSDYLTWDQMKAMQASGLVQFESHTVHHVDMSQISLVRAQKELTDSKVALEEHLGVVVRY